MVGNCVMGPVKAVIIPTSVPKAESARAMAMALFLAVVLMTMAVESAWFSRSNFEMKRAIMIRTTRKTPTGKTILRISKGSATTLRPFNTKILKSSRTIPMPGRTINSFLTLRNPSSPFLFKTSFLVRSAIIQGITMIIKRCLMISSGDTGTIFPMRSSVHRGTINRLNR